VTPLALIPTLGFVPKPVPVMVTFALVPAYQVLGSMDEICGVGSPAVKVKTSSPSDVESANWWSPGVRLL